jgi:hypothetical protein
MREVTQPAEALTTMIPLAKFLPAATLAAVVLTCTAAACGERARTGEPGAAIAAAEPDESMDGAAPAAPPVDPCALLTEKEISEQLLLTLSPSDVANLTPKEFKVAPSEVPWGESRRCEFAYESKDRNGGDTPVLRGTFNVMVSRIAFADAIQQKDKQPVTGAGPEIFKYQKMGEKTYYVTKGKYAASLTDFRGTYDPSGASQDGSRVALLRRIADRLP